MDFKCPDFNPNDNWAWIWLLIAMLFYNQGHPEEVAKMIEESGMKESNFGKSLEAYHIKDPRENDIPVYKCGCAYSYRDWREDFCTDCHFYSEDKDMGATIPWCGKLGRPLEPGDCQKTCENYISSKEINELVKQYLEARKDGAECI